jgi:hypothetical protein
MTIWLVAWCHVSQIITVVTQIIVELIFNSYTNRFQAVHKSTIKANASTCNGVPDDHLYQLKHTDI